MYKKIRQFALKKSSAKRRKSNKHINLHSIFYHPDFTVGTGITPVQPAKQKACQVRGL